jgi:hypothetical protein
MKLLDVSKCHEDSPEFRSSLEKMEEGMQGLERQMRKICALCEEREALAQKDRQLYSELISEFEFFVKHEVDVEEPTLAVSTDLLAPFGREILHPLPSIHLNNIVSLTHVAICYVESDRGDDHWSQAAHGQQRENV